MAINNFKPFATAANANVTAQADWESLPALLSGFTAGKASSAQVNKAIRQASFIAAALAQYTANKSGLDVLDDGDLNGFIAKMSAAFGKDFQALDATLTALAGLATGANKLPYFTGNDTAAQTDLTSVGRDIIGKNTIADILTYLHLEETVSRAANAMQINMDGKDIRDPATFRKSLNLGDSATRNTGSGLAEVVTGSILNFVIASLELKSASRVDVGTGSGELPSNATVASTIASALASFLPKRAFTSTDYIRIPDVPGGLIIQWGRFSTQLPANSSGNITLPTAFPNGGLFALAFYSGDSGLQSTFNALVGSGSVKVFNTHPTNAATPSVLAFGY